VLVPVVGAVVILTAVIFFVSQYMMHEQAETMALTKVRSDINLMYELLEEMIPGPWRVEGDLLFKGDRLINNDDQLVDWISHLTGNTVTIFRGGTRIATTVRTGGERAIGTEAAAYVIEQVLRNKQPYYGKADVAGNLYQTAYRPLFDEHGNAVGMLYTGASPKIIDQRVAAFRGGVLLLSGVVCVVLAVALYILLSRSILKPVAAAAQHAVRIAAGDLRLEMSRDVKRQDEIGMLTNAFQDLVISLRSIIGSLQKMAAKAAETGESLLASSQENSATLEEVASSVGEFTQAVSAVNGQMEEMARGAEDVRRLAGGGQSEMDHTVQSMGRIVERSRQTKAAVAMVSSAAESMGVVLDVISDIAEQTNLLALNAAIEAARAGEQGRGFAVVAEEVRKLAEQTQESVAKIAGMNGSLMSEVAKAVAAIGETENEVAEGQKALNQTRASFEAIMNEIDAMAARINGIAASTKAMDSTSESLAAAAEQQAASMSEVAHMAETVASMVNELQELIGRFKV